MIDPSNKRVISRREWAAIAGLITSSTTLAAQQSTDPSARNYLEEQRNANARALAELESFPLEASDEPIFGMVVR